MASDRIAAVVERVRREGWCAVRGVIPPTEVAVVYRAVMEVAEREWEQHSVNGRLGIGGLIAKTQAMVPYVLDERLLGTAEALFGPKVRISMTHGIVTDPGYERTNWHGDWPFSLGNPYQIPAPYAADQPVKITTLWALTPFNATTGGTLIVPGSHTAGNNPGGDIGYDISEPVASEMQPELEPGDVLVIDSRTWHTNGTNRSDGQRVGMAVRYAAWWYNVHQITPGLAEFEQMAAETGDRASDVVPISREIYDALPEKAKPLFRHIVIGQRVLPDTVAEPAWG